MSMDRVEYAYRYLIGKGVAPHQAAAMVGSFMQESGRNLNTRAVGDSGTAFGVAQWRGSRWRGLQNFAASAGRDPYAIDTQLDYALNEMSGPEARAGRMVRSAHDLDGAMRGMQAYERYGVAGNRHQLARDVLNRFGGEQGTRYAAEPQPPSIEGAAGATAGAGAGRSRFAGGGGGTRLPQVAGWRGSVGPEQAAQTGTQSGWDWNGGDWKINWGGEPQADAGTGRSRFRTAPATSAAPAVKSPLRPDYQPEPTQFRPLIRKPQPLGGTQKPWWEQHALK